MIDLRRMQKEEVHRLGELDVSETGEFVYRFVDGRVVKTAESWCRPRWDKDECKRRIDSISGGLERGDGMIGAFDGDALVGLAIVRYRLTETQAELAGLWVSRSHRRRGVATMLTDEVERLARNDGAATLYISACPSESAVGFYRSRGCRPTDKVNAELFEREPEDIHMTKDLQPPRALK